LGVCIESASGRSGKLARAYLTPSSLDLAEEVLWYPTRAEGAVIAPYEATPTAAA